ncbi:MAG: hypothetical protein JSU01_02380, partial [Bacteroidetes bacterium]|nr:hypothetical protein [Bacteroidota bacterium]
MKKKIFIEIITASFILLFVYAAASKLMSFGLFRFQLSRAPYFGRFSVWVAWVIPAGELIIASLLFITRTRYAGLWASFIAMLLFTVYVGTLLLSGMRLPCTCGGLIQKLSWREHLV